MFLEIGLTKSQSLGKTKKIYKTDERSKQLYIQVQFILCSCQLRVTPLKSHKTQPFLEISNMQPCITSYNNHLE